MVVNDKKYVLLKKRGHSAKDVYLVAKADGLDRAQAICIIRAVFGLSLSDAKEVVVTAEALGSSLDAYQRTLVDEIENLLHSGDATREEGR